MPCDEKDAANHMSDTTITVIGRKDGQVVAKESASTSNEAAQIAKRMKDSGLDVEVKRA